MHAHLLRLIPTFEPLSRKCFPSSVSVARVWMEAASLPLKQRRHSLHSGLKQHELVWMFNLVEMASDLPGSVRQNAAICSPEASRGKYLAFCSSVPAIRIPWNNSVREFSLCIKSFQSLLCCFSGFNSPKLRWPQIFSIFSFLIVHQPSKALLKEKKNKHLEAYYEVAAHA